VTEELLTAVDPDNEAALALVEAGGERELLCTLFGRGSVFGRLVDGFVDPSASVGGPWYVGEWTALVVFLLWLVVPLGLAYLRFDGGDLT
jgi:hypothetical protein